MRIVEAERARLHLSKADVAVDAGEVLREEHLLAVHYVNQDDAARHSERGLYRVCDAGRVGAVAGHEPIDDDLDGVPLLLVEVERLAEVVDLAVHPDPDEPRLPRVLKHVLVLALAPLHHRREYLEPRPVRQAEHGVHDLLDRLTLDRSSALVTVGTPDPGKQQPEVVVYLSDRADGRARVVRHSLLVDGDRGRQTLNVIYVWLVHPSEELPRVGRERLDVSALTLGVDRIEGERTLAGA